MKNLIRATLAAGSLLCGAAAHAELTSTDAAVAEMSAIVDHQNSLADETHSLAKPFDLAVEGLVPAFDLTAAQDAEADALVPSDALDAERGGALVIADQDLTAITAGNVLQGDYIAGNISISDNALSNFTGIGNVLINTGGLTSIQSGINVTINTVN